MGFHVITADGNLKLTPLAGATLPDPVTVIHGGTGLTSLAKGDILYASADGTISKLAIDTAGIRILTSDGDSTNLVPHWSDPAAGLNLIPRQITRKSSSAQAFGSSTTPQTWIWATTNTGTVTNRGDINPWIRYSTSNVTGNQAGFRVNSDWVWLDHLPTVTCFIRMGPDLAGVRFFMFLSNSGTFPTNADDQSALKGVGFRYSTVAADAGFVPWSANGATQSTGTAFTTGVTPNQMYAIKMTVTSTTSASFTANGGAAQTISIPAGALGTAMRVQIVITNTASAIRSFDFASMYGESN